MTGRTVVITGAGRGLGLITARELAGAGAHVVLGVRDPQRARRAVADLPGIFDVRPLDVAELGSVRAFAEAWSGDVERDRRTSRGSGSMSCRAARTRRSALRREVAARPRGPATTGSARRASNPRNGFRWE
ncbi:SDR family NAD(P)-dependent oxidoreductase [Nocardia kruczakiae]|uniref:SDR family NAD(P)-dependent oxidoreductase n=1 Tax=Nocardia kruczakiae TaxID=261477 RepID=UPI001C3F96D1